MSEETAPSQIPGPQPITPEQLAELKARAKELAIQQTMAQMATARAAEQSQVVYVKRNLTVAELLLVFLISCGIVTGIQYAWGVVTNVLPKIEIKVK